MVVESTLFFFIILSTCIFNTTFAQEEERDYTSRVPKFTFGNILEEQEAQLKDNPLIARFKKNREILAADPYRPLFHYVNPENGMNDPNGLCFWKGRWHLFYQGYPLEDSRTHWGHAASDDLVHWRDLPYAIYPNPEEHCYSGSTLVEDDRVIAMYFGTKKGNMVAISDDPLLLNWEKLTGKAVIPITESNVTESRPYWVYDPCIWKKGDSYYSLSGVHLREGPANKHIRINFLFKSRDLKNWKYLHPFVEDDRFTMVGDDGACPYFWPIGDKHILLFFSHMSGGQYLIGDYDKKRDKFIATSNGTFNYGPSAPCGVHAPSACPDGKGGVITIFNMNAGRRSKGWNQIMTLPMRLTLADNEQLKIEPAGKTEVLRYNHQHLDEFTLPANNEIVLRNIRGDAKEIIVEINAKNTPMIEMNVLRSPDKQEYTRILFFRNRGHWNGQLKKMESLVSIDTSRSSLLSDLRNRPAETAPVILDEDENLKLRIFIDKSVVEIFVNEKKYLATRVYPSLKESLGISFMARGEDSVIKSFDAWDMKSIW